MRKSKVSNLCLPIVCAILIGTFYLANGNRFAVAQSDTERLIALARAETFDPINSKNGDWPPFTWSFGNGIEMVLVPQGCLLMGNPNQEEAQPVHRICIDEPFWIDRTEVTRSMYRQCIEAGICNIPPDSNVSWEDNHPVSRVTWGQATKYCEWRGVGVSLPTEAQWEFAARGVSGWLYPWGNSWNEHAVVYSNTSNGQTSAVGGRPLGASWVGAVDMSGNVWEWVYSISDPYPYDPDDGREGIGDRNGRRVTRGGSLSSNNAVELTTYYRGSAYQIGENGRIGFRCVRNFKTSQ